METKKSLTADQLDKLKTSVRQRFDELYQRIGSNRQTLSNKVLTVDQAITKELAKEKIDAAREKDILNRVRAIERDANNQLPHIQKKVVAPPPATAPAAKAAKPKSKKK